MNIPASKPVKRIEFTIPGPPGRKERPRVARGRAYTPKQTAQAENLVKLMFQQAAPHHTPHEGPVDIVLVIGRRPPKSWPKWRRESQAPAMRRCCKAPDIDNTVKLVCDALNGLAYRDDRQVAAVEARRVWLKRDDPEGVVVKLAFWPEQTRALAEAYAQAQEETDGR